MPSKKRKKTIFDSIFGDFFEDNIFDETDELFGGLKNAGTGYSMQISQINGEPVVTVKAYGQVDRKALEKELKEKYPNARINIEIYSESGERKPFIEEITQDNTPKNVSEKKTSVFSKQKDSLDIFKTNHRVMIEEIKNSDSENKSNKKKK